jgi:molybdopterin synthase catalytic subunit
MDFLKTEAPFWKKEVSQDGERWIESRQADYLAVEQWKSKPT